VSASAEQFVAALRAEHDEWTATWQQLHAERGEVLYHYTGAGGLLGIVEEQQPWASNAAFLNDSSELVYIREVLAEVGQELRAKYDVHADISAYAASPGRWPASQRRAAVAISMLESAPTFPGGLFDVYVACFSADGDLLSQWRGYPPDGGGYALGLRSARLLTGGGLLRRVIYDRETQRRLLSGLISPVVDAVASADALVDEHETDPLQLLIPEHFAAVSTSVIECGFCFKHPGFKEESEWRLVILRPRDSKYRPTAPPPLVRATPTGLLPYITRSLDVDAVANITVGPGSRPTLAADAAVQLLRNAGYENAESIVEHSSIPLRV
jgi:hypothetical protein